MDSKIDIIVPIYNVEPYLEQCLKSIVNQSMPDIRVICVNDGSTDRSLDILQHFAHADSRISIISQNNKGYGAAINCGLSSATSQYIGIVEPDDFIDPVCFETLYNLAVKSGNADIAKCAYYEYYDNPDGTHQLKSSASSQLPSHLAPFKIEEYPDLLLYHPSVWSAIYKRKFLEDRKLRFVEAPGAAWTDNPFFISSICCAEKLVWSNECHYYYRKTNPSASSNLKDCSIPLDRALDMLRTIEHEHITHPAVTRAIYKRCLNYIQIVTEHPNYIPSIHNRYIRQIVSHIPSENIQIDFFTIQEQAIHKIFSVASEK